MQLTFEIQCLHPKRKHSVSGRLPKLVFFNLLLLALMVFTSMLFTPVLQARAAGAASAAATVGEVNVTPRPDGLSIEIGVSAPITPTTVRLRNPDRLVLDFPGYELKGASRGIEVNSGPVHGLRLSLFRVHPPTTRIVVDSAKPLDFKVKTAANGVVVEINFPNGAAASASGREHPAQPAKEQAATSATSPKQARHDPAARETDVRTNPRTNVRTTTQPDAYTLQAKAKGLRLEDLDTLENRAAFGDPEAQTTLALAFHAGNLLKRDDAEALRLLHQAADKGYVAAEESLGIFSESGIGTDKPAPAEALDWYKKAARQGSLNAVTNMGLMYAEGRGVTKDPAQAVTLFRQAAEGGDAAAQYNLSLMYARGNGVPQDDKESVHWLTAAADHNVIAALIDLGIFYMEPTDKTAPDVGRAIGYYEKAAELGSARAQAILGRIFAKGVQGKPDYEQSVKWYRKAAEQGLPEGEAGLAIRYALGQGVPVDAEEARRLFTAAAGQGLGEAQFDLGTMCEEGNGAPADRAEAAHYFQMAAEQGLVRAQFRLGRLLASKPDSGSDRVSAYKWLMLAQSSIQQASPILVELKKSMSEQEIADAEHAVDDWRVAHAGKQRSDNQHSDNRR
jgi:TPR repeat protein